MMLTALTIAAQLQFNSPKGVSLQPSYAITEQADSQPALGFNVYQPTSNPQLVAAFGNAQAADRLGKYQKTLNVWRLQGSPSSDL